MDLAARVRDIIEPTVDALGFELVRVTFGGSRVPILQIMAERPDGTMTVSDCADLSHEVSALLDVEDPIQTEYNLEVSSPGIDRPLTRAKDFDRWAGHEAKVELDQGIDDRRRFKGLLKGRSDDRIAMLLDDGEEVELPLSRIIKAKLILTDALIKAAGDLHGPVDEGESYGSH